MKHLKGLSATGHRLQIVTISLVTNSISSLQGFMLSIVTWNLTFHAEAPNSSFNSTS